MFKYKTFEIKKIRRLFASLLLNLHKTFGSIIIQELIFLFVHWGVMNYDESDLCEILSLKNIMLSYDW